MIDLLVTLHLVHVCKLALNLFDSFAGAHLWMFLDNCIEECTNFLLDERFCQLLLCYNLIQQNSLSQCPLNGFLHEIIFAQVV